MNVAFLGRGETGLTVLEAILDDGFEVPFVWTCRHTPEVGASREAFEAVAEEHDIPFEYVDDVNREEYVERLRESDVTVAVAVFWMDRVSKRVLETTEHGFLNLHGGDLPRYRGNAAANWAILEGESELGVTVHRMVPELDAGPILAQETVPIDDETTVADLVEATRRVGRYQILEVLRSYRDGNPVPEIEQDENRALRCYPRLPEYGELDWSEPAADIDRHVRSLNDPYPAAFTYHGLRRVDVLKTSVEYPDYDFLAEPGHIVRTESDGPIWVAAGDGLVVVERVRIEDGSPIAPGNEFRSIRDRFGTDVTERLRDIDARLSALEDDAD